MGTVLRENEKVYIEGVRKISWDTGEMCEFASALVSALKCLGEDTPYHYVMGTSGAAFRFTLNPGEWDYGNYSIRNISADMDEPIRRAFAAAGYACSIYAPGTFAEDAARIMDSIDRGVPALAFHVVGPSDCCVISGYDAGGAVLMGWSTYQDIPQDHNIPHDATGYFRKPGWHENMPGYVLIGEKVERSPLRDIYLGALKWAVHLICTPRMGRNATGIEGLRVWAEEMVDESYFPAGNEDIIGGHYLSAAINLTMVRDHGQAEPFLRQAAADVPDFAPELSRAAGCYAEVKRLTGVMNDLISDNFSERAMRAIHEPETRRAYADAILRIREAEEEAAGWMEKLIERGR